MRKLNIFQRCIRVWEEAHPYNAAQVLEIAGKGDVRRIEEAWNESLAACGLGMVRVAGKRYGYEKAPRREVAVVERELGLERFITREINRPFDEPGKMGRGGVSVVMPFRPFVAEGCGGPEEESHYMGVVYQHWVADSVAMRMVLREWFFRLHDPGRAEGEALAQPEGGLWRYFGPGRSGWRLGAGAMGMWRSLRAFKGARRLEAVNDDHGVVCTLHRLPEGLIDGLVEAARRRKATINDLLLAALARACDEHGAAPRRSERDLALGTIVDLRGLSGENLERTFGLFLGFTELVIRAEDLRERERLVGVIAEKNARLKEKRAAAASMLRMAAGFMQGRFLSQKRLAAFYRNYMPLFGGVSNVNMKRAGARAVRGAWPAGYHPSPLLDYIRVAPTGPMVPVVIAATTMGRRFTFVLTRRSSVVDEESGRRLAQAFVDELTALHKMG